MNYIVLLLVTVNAARAVVQIDTVPQLNLTQYVGRWYQVTVATQLHSVMVTLIGV